LFVLLLYFMFFFAIVEFGRVMWLRSSVTYWAQLGARYAMVQGSGATQESVVNYVMSHVTNPPGEHVEVKVDWPDGAAAGSPVEVTVSLPFTFLIPGIELDAKLLSSSAQMTIAGPPSG